MSPLELIGTVFGFINIYLLVRRSVWNFPAALAMVSCVGFVLFEARLYAEAGLQVFFFVVNLWGWWLWSRVKDAGDQVPVGWMSWPARFAWLGVTAIASIALGLAMDRWTDAALPMADSAVAGMSVTAQLLLSFRRIENWFLWIVIDLVSIGLYVMRDLPLLALLYVAFLAMSVLGQSEWTRAYRRDRQMRREEAAV
ncbi:nicotinamide riboside transporter PnuC [Altererythrobacter sp. FM1]|uniref:Nicotinamide riboside transporter PnuC n=1 Tax=Tsuneonella flava TaxID=2055955 RepID=A0ABX7KCQ6_9SPHN|nr:nicotinamide riboside transporter PnuC [Tsuneonella flava]QSB45752.1 nicotinamide mononucleotide transporter [Tsuneonella flava]ROT97295.1 nicotinamide riboside transporter PnuC [Altererythrobacter sp. FM1]